MSLQLYARLSKVNVALRQVTGVMASESLDRSREVFDYEASKPHFEKWSGEFAKTTDGKSLGNVRAMHGKVAAGRLVELEFDDVNKAIVCTAEIVDDNEWEKVEKGLYTGFSIGGKYMRKWTDGEGQKRYEAEPHEVSIVDLPCNKDATFTVIKAAGDGEPEVEERAFDASVTSGEPVQDEANEADAEKAASTEGQDVLPRDGELRLQEGTVEKFTDGAWAAVGKLAVEPEPSQDDLAKSAYHIRQLAELAESCRWLCESRSYELWDAASQSYAPIPDALKSAAVALYDALLVVVNEDVDKAKEMIALKVADGDLQKAAGLTGDEGDNAIGVALGNLAKSLGMEPAAYIEAIQKVAADNVDLRKQLDDATTKLNAQPEAARASLGVVEKAALTGGNEGSTATASVDASPEEVTKSAFASALSKPMRVLGGLGN